MKGMWSGENDEVSLGNRVVRRNIKWGTADKISVARAVSYSH